VEVTGAPLPRNLKARRSRKSNPRFSALVLGAFTPYAMMMNRNAKNHYFDKRDAAYQPYDSWREWLL
jgi:hypothetical protein